MHKKFWKSKTVLFNGLTTILAVLSIAGVSDFMPAKWIALINAAGNIILRVWFTSTEIK